MLCYSTASLPDSFTHTDIIDALLPTPFRGVEWVVTPEDLQRVYRTSFWSGVRADFEANGFFVRNVQLGHPHLLGPVPHSPGLSSRDPAGRKQRIDAALAAAWIAERLGSTYVTVTTGLPEISRDTAADSTVNTTAHEDPELNRDRQENPDLQEALFQESLAEIVARRPATIRIAIEQEPEHVIRSATQVLKMCQAFEGHVFSNYDVGHGAVLGEDPAAAVRLLGKYLSNIHLEDIKGRTHKHLMFGDGDIDFAALFAALREIGYAGDLTPDLYPFKDQPVRALRESAAFLAEMGHRE